MDRPGDTTGWLVKDDGYEDCYGSKSLASVAINLDNVMMKKMDCMNVNELDKKINFREYGVVEDEFISKSLVEIQNPVVKKREEAPVVKRVVDKPIFENIGQKEDSSIIDEQLKHDKLVLNIHIIRFSSLLVNHI